MAPDTDIVYAIVREDKMGKPSKKGHLVAYSLQTEKEIWKVEFNQKMATLAFHGAMPILICENYSEAFSPTSGTTVWRQPMQIRRIVPNAGIAIAGHHDPGIGRLNGFDIETGETKWKFGSKLLRSFDNLAVFGDTVVTIVWPDFHQVDLRTGEGFSVELKGHHQGNVTGTVLFGLLFGVVGAMVYYGVTSPGIKMTVGSDLDRMLLYKGITYDASTTEITAIGSQGKILWSFGNSRGFVGIPKIFVHDDVIYALFPGILSTQDGYIQGHAVIIKIDPFNGKELDIAWLSDAKTQFVTDFAVNGDTMLVAMNNKMLSLNINNLQTITSKQFGDVNFGSGLDRIVQPPYYVLSGNEIIKESETQLEKLYIQNTSGMKIEISKDFEPVGVVPKSRFFRFAGNAGTHTAYVNDTRAVIANSENMVLPFEFGPDFHINTNYFWDWNAKSLVLVPIRGMDLNDGSIKN
jgi:outer membrane protein assembly factor BamB